MRITPILAAGIGLAFAGIALAQDDPIAARQALMKQNGAAAKTAGNMVKGVTEFDASAAAEAMQAIQDDMEKFPTLFPEGSDEGDTDASPAIWENMEDFRARAEKLKDDAAAAEEAAAEGLEAFATAFVTVGQNCGGCHEAYRK